MILRRGRDEYVGFGEKVYACTALDGVMPECLQGDVDDGVDMQCCFERRDESAILPLYFRFGVFRLLGVSARHGGVPQREVSRLCERGHGREELDCSCRKRLE